MAEEFISGDVPDGWKAEWISVPHQAECGAVIYERFLVASPIEIPNGTTVSGAEVSLKPKKPRAAMVPGTASVILGSEKTGDSADIHQGSVVKQKKDNG